jgi:hypothetical protein
VADYICVDGPLEGRLFRWRKPPRTDRLMTVAVLDVEHAVIAVDYRVRPPAEPAGAGRLEFVAVHDAHPERATPLWSRARGAAGRLGRRLPRPPLPGRRLAR